MILHLLVLAADSLSRSLGALPAGVTDGYATTLRGERFSYQSAHPTEHASLLVFAGLAIVFGLFACDQTTMAPFDATPDPVLVAQGQSIFRYETFGYETFWTDRR